MTFTCLYGFVELGIFLLLVVLGAEVIESYVQVIHSAGLQLLLCQVQTLLIKSLINHCHRATLKTLSYFLHSLCCHYCPRTSF